MDKQSEQALIKSIENIKRGYEDKIAELETKLKEASIAICLYCGYEFNKHGKTKLEVVDEMMAHIAECPGHPLLKAAEDLVRAGEIIVGLIEAVEELKAENAELRAICQEGIVG